MYDVRGAGGMSSVSAFLSKPRFVFVLTETKHNIP